MSSVRIRGSMLLALIVVTVAIVALVSGLAVRRVPTDQLAQQARTEFRRGDFASSERTARQVLEREPAHTQALLIAADALYAQKRFEEAVEFYDRYPPGQSDQTLRARSMAGRILMEKLRQLSAAEIRFRQALEIDPRSTTGNRSLADLLEAEGRVWEATPFRMVSLMGPEVAPEHLHSVATGQPLQNAEQTQAYWNQYRKAAPQDPAPVMALAELAMKNGQPEDAVELLRHAHALHPDLLEITAGTGRGLAELKQGSEFLLWMKTLPQNAAHHPGVWNLRGQWAAEHEQKEAAARCFWESLRLDPTNARVCYRLGMTLTRLGRKQDSGPLLERSRMLERYIQACEFGLKGWKIENAAKLADELGLYWEAFAWWKMLAFILNEEEQPDQTAMMSAARRARALGQLLEQAPLTRTLPEKSPVIHLDLSSYPLPDTSIVSGSESGDHTDIAAAHDVHFEDQASTVGISFTYHNGHGPDGGRLLKSFYQMNGGGAAVLDYDLDGWPDIYLTQGCPWPVNSGQQTYLDRLYRNLGNGRFVDVTTDARLRENGFSQGVAAGDINQDGAPDLYVANIGHNRLYINNGDGTFTDASASLAGSGNRWTVSCLIADLNGDHLPELFDANYLEGADVFTRICRLADGREVTCSPASFDASHDQLFLNTGDGRLIDCSSAAGIEVPDGRGLGVVAADFRNVGKLDLFVANDLSPNFYFRNDTQGRGASPEFTESAVLAGLAFDSEGLAQACMGIAVGDANHDQRLDLFVTNFYNESNTLYQMIDGELSDDATRNSGLRQPSLLQLGFGTQFLDVELDGDLDLILTNGNIDELGVSLGVPCQMPPQLMLNDGHGYFHEASPSSVGSFFEGRYLGRGLARVDWNRDGRDDVVISHLDAPVALLTNTSSEIGHSLSLRLVGVNSDRDAIGTAVTCVTGDLVQMQQLTAGDGFAASNERMIRFGTGTAAVIDRLHVRWISGTTQEFESIAVDQHLLLIEGRATPIPLRFEGTQ